MSLPYALMVFTGAGIGGLLRWLVGIAAGRWFGMSFPWGTMIVNVSGSFVMGVLAALLLFRAGAAEWQGARLFLLTGVLGGYTTFSSYALDVATLWEQGSVSTAALYGLGSVVLAVAGLVAGLALVRSLA